MGIKYGRGCGGAWISLLQGSVLLREYFPSSSKYVPGEAEIWHSYLETSLKISQFFLVFRSVAWHSNSVAALHISKVTVRRARLLLTLGGYIISACNRQLGQFSLASLCWSKGGNATCAGWQCDHSVIPYDTIRDAILTCARKPTWVGLIYRMQTTTKNCKTEKLKSKNSLTVKSLGESCSQSWRRKRKAAVGRTCRKRRF